MTRRQGSLFPDMPPTKKFVADFPELVAEWHPSKNGSVATDDYLVGSNKKVWWICKNGHEWRTAVHQRALSGTSCPHCFNEKRPDLMRPKPDKGQSLADQNPTVCLEWDYKKNQNAPSFYLPKSSTKVWWRCAAGDDHSWLARIDSRTAPNDGTKNGCPFCTGRRPSQLYNLRVSNPDLVAEWHFIKNQKSPEHYLPKSNHKVWWICKKGHEWESSINNRAAGRSCPQCSNKSSSHEVRLLSELRAIFGQVGSRCRFDGYEVDLYIPEYNTAIEYDGSYWHENSNEKDVRKQSKIESMGIRLLRIRERPLKKLRPTDIITSSSSELAKIEVDELVTLIAPQDSRCLEYLSKDTFVADEDYRKYMSYFPSPFPEHSLAHSNPDLAGQWHPYKNYPLQPENFAPNSSQRVWWQCDKGHEWRVSINNRQKRGCPYCSGRYPTPENCLAATHEKLAVEWHSDKNGSVTPSDVSSGSGQKVWWKCENGHEWKASVGSRARSGSGCPFCSGMYASPENCMAVTHPELARLFHPTKNGDLSPKNLKAGTGKRLWWRCECGHEWQQTGSNAIKTSSRCPRCRKLARS